MATLIGDYPNKTAEIIGTEDLPKPVIATYLREIMAECSEKTANVTGPQNLRKPLVALHIAERMAKRSERAKVDQDYVLYRLVDLNVPLSAIRAGYSAKAAYIADLMDGMVKKTKIGAGYVLRHLHRIGEVAVHDILNDDGTRWPVK